MLTTGMVTLSGSCDEMAGAEWFCLIWLHILKKLAVKMLVWNSAWPGPRSLHAWSKAHTAEMDLFILGSQHLHPCSPGEDAEHSMTPLLLLWQQAVDQELEVCPREEWDQGQSKVPVETGNKINLGIGEVGGRSWRTSLCLQQGEGENPPLTAELLLNPKE